MKKSAITAIIAIVLVCIFTAGGVVGNMLGLFSKGNSVEYSPKQCTLEESSLYGKKIIFLGSSVTYGYCSLGDSFVDYLEHQYGVVPIKEAKSGTTLVDNGKNSYVSRMKTIDKNISADAFVCQLSTNDATKNMPLGEISDSYDIKTFDTQTVIGAIEYIIAYAKATWSCPVIFFTNPKYDSDVYAKMVEVIDQLSQKWTIGVIDLWNDDEVNDMSASNDFMNDDIHPTRRGYKELWTPVFKECLERFTTRYY